MPLRPNQLLTALRQTAARTKPSSSAHAPSSLRRSRPRSHASDPSICRLPARNQHQRPTPHRSRNKAQLCGSRTTHQTQQTSALRPRQRYSAVPQSEPNKSQPTTSQRLGQTAPQRPHPARYGSPLPVAASSSPKTADSKAPASSYCSHGSNDISTRSGSRPAAYTSTVCWPAGTPTVSPPQRPTARPETFTVDPIGAHDSTNAALPDAAQQPPKTERSATRKPSRAPNHRKPLCLSRGACIASVARRLAHINPLHGSLGGICQLNKGHRSVVARALPRV